VVPVGDRILYMEPVFLAAEANAIPELRRFIVSDGLRVTMNETLEGAVAALADGVAEPGDLELLLAAPTETDAGPAAGQALELLREAETRLRQGDYAGFGAALDRLEELLRSMASGG
jgi:hypothetical protein